MKLLSILFGLLALLSIVMVYGWHLINNVKSGHYGVSFDWHAIGWGTGVTLIFSALAYLLWSNS